MNRGLTATTLDGLLDTLGELQSGLITPEKFASLQQTFRRDDQAVQIYVEYVSQTVAMRDQVTAEGESHDDLPVFRKIAFEREPESFAVSPRVVKLTTLAISLTLLLMLFVSTFFIEGLFEIDNSPQIVAFPAQLIDARMGVDRVPTHGVRPAEQIYLEEGIAQYRMANGALVNVQAPAIVEFVSIDCVRVISGLIDADVPTPAIGFSVETPRGRITDLGTRFCIKVQADGQTQCAVTSGLVEAYPINADPADGPAQPIKLTAGTAVDVQPGKVVSIDHASVVEQFVPMDLAIHGLLSRSNNLAVLREPPKSLDLYAGTCLLFEQQHVVLSGREQVNYTQSGETNPADDNVPTINVPAGATVSSVLFLARVPQGVTTHTEGIVQMRFSCPILGVITSRQELLTSQMDFALPQTAYQYLQQDELPGLDKNDSFHISEDRRTLVIRYKALTDCCRILLQVDEG